MTNTKSSGNRRKLLKTIAAGSGAIAAGRSLPDKWTAPIVDAVFLPAHAETTSTTTSAPVPTSTPVPTTPVPSQCNPDPITVTDDGTGTSTDAIGIIFDGSNGCTLVIGDIPSDISDPNLVLMADSDYGNTTQWWSYDVSRNWTPVSASYASSGPNSFGPHWLVFSGGGNQYRVSFTLTRPSGSTMTMSGVTIVPN